jgi:hypothetical protein
MIEVGVIKQAVKRGMTVGEVGPGYASSLSFFLPQQVADQLIEWYRNEACDGFVILPPYLQEEDDLFLRQGVPRLQEAGVFRREYPGTTLRDTLGLQRPVSRYPWVSAVCQQ